MKNRIIERKRMRVGDVCVNPHNIRNHGDEQKKALRAVLDEFGQVQGLIGYYSERNDGKLTLFDGHARSEVGPDEEWEIVITDLTDDEVDRLVFYYDPISAMADTNKAAVEQLLKVVEESNPALQALLQETAQSVGLTWGGSTEPLGDDEGEVESSRHAELIEKWGTETGQLWLIPSITNRFVTHRLLCGDCTVSEDVKRVMDGQRAVLFATDPPYLVEYDGTNHPHKWGSPDENKDWSELYIDPTWDKADGNENLYDDFIRLAVETAIAPNAAWYCWHASRRQAMLEEVWERHGAFVHQQIIWAKDRPVLTRSWYMWQHEPCFMGWVKGKKPPRYGDDHPRSVWEFPTILPGVKTDHPTSKPIELFEIPMKQHTQVGEICYDPFMGSGSQLVAGEKLGRAVYGIEQEPAFIAVILERIAAMGLTPKLS